MNEFGSRNDELLADELRDIFRADANVEMPGRLADRIASIPERRRSISGPRLLGALPIGSLIVACLVVAALVWGVPRFAPMAGTAQPSGVASTSPASCELSSPTATPEGSGPTPTPYPATPTPAGPTPTPAPGSFRPVGSMTTARDGATAIRLRDGRVLVVGGKGDGGELASAELYDPATCTFSATGSMPEARSGFTATLLQDGRVLIAGGFVPNRDLAPALLYVPTTGSFIPTGSMVTARAGHSATLLQDGRVLIAGGEAFDPASNASHVLASAELYDPNAGTFTLTGSMPTQVIGEAVALLPNGKVLFAGGNTGAGYTGDLTSANLYDPATGTFSATGSMVSGWGETATVLRNGIVLILGQTRSLPIGSLPATLPSAELYDPATGTFSMTGPYTAPGGTATLLHDGHVLVLGGSLGEAGPHLLGVAAAHLYDPASGTFGPTRPMTAVRAGPAVALLADGSVLVAGGDGPGMLLNSAELFEP